MNIIVKHWTRSNDTLWSQKEGKPRRWTLHSSWLPIWDAIQKMGHCSVLNVTELGVHRLEFASAHMWSESWGTGLERRGRVYKFAWQFKDIRNDVQRIPMWGLLGNYYHGWKLHAGGASSWFPDRHSSPGLSDWTDLTKAPQKLTWTVRNAHIFWEKTIFWIKEHIVGQRTTPKENHANEE